MRSSQHPLVDGIVLPVPRHDNPNSTSCDISESDLESSELIANDEKHSMGLPGIFCLWQEFWRKPERQSDLRRLIEVGFEHVPTAGLISDLRS
jgi:hypothetical protein